MNIAICEDNKNEQGQLKEIINRWVDENKFQVKLLCYECAEDFLFDWPDIEVDLVFLDIKMKEVDGIELAKKIRDKDQAVQIVFTTSFKQYSLKGYETYPLHYLIKPLSSKTILPLLDKVATITSSRTKDMLAFSTSSEIIRLNVGQINYIQMKSHIAEIHSDTGIVELRKTIKELLGMLPTHFVRCHRSVIVNLLKVDCVYSKHLKLTSGEEINISRNELGNVKKAFVELYND